MLGSEDFVILACVLLIELLSVTDTDRQTPETWHLHSKLAYADAL